MLLFQLDIPKIVTGPLLQVLAEHMQLYINVKRKGIDMTGSSFSF